MADQEQLAILKQGVDRWNAWRQDSPEEQPNLEGADLGGADLRGAHLRDADLRDADLGGAHLQGADEHAGAARHRSAGPSPPLASLEAIIERGLTDHPSSRKKVPAM